MRSKNRVISVSKAVNLGTMPTFVRLVHKHFEKECPVGTGIASCGRVSEEFEAPLDLLRMAITDKSLLSNVESVTFTYTPQSNARH